MAMAALFYSVSFFFLFLFLFFFFFSSFPSSSLAWGVHGHYATCLIAQNFFSDSTRDAVQSLLPEYAKGDLPSLCAWPDQIRSRYKWSGSLHYIDTPDFYCNYNYHRDCHDSSGILGRCVAGAINNYTSQLTTYFSNLQQYNLTEALLFLSHFVGDIHQPLHVGFTSDLGGNAIKVHWYQHARNLHHVWDDDIIELTSQRFYESSIKKLVEDLSNNIMEGKWNTDMPGWGTCGNGDIVCPDIYAAESINAACKWAYRNATPGSYLTDDYFLTRMPIVEIRLAQGGVRLAAILNRIFGQSEIHTY